MIYYAIKNNQLLDEVSENKKALEMSLQANGHTEYELYSTEYEDFTPSNPKYTVDLTTFKVGLNPDYESILAERERARIAMLNLTAADVERAIYKVKGLDFDDIITFVEQSGAQIDLKALKIELRANNFYRGNPYIEQVGTLLGFTSEQLDRFFETNDYKELTK